MRNASVRRGNVGRLCRQSTSKPTFGPLNDANPFRVQVFLQAGCDDQLWCFQTVEVQVEKRQSSAGVRVNQGEGGRLDAGGDPEAAREAFDQLSFSRTQISGQADDQSVRNTASPRLTKGLGF